MTYIVPSEFKKFRDLFFSFVYYVFYLLTFYCPYILPEAAFYEALKSFPRSIQDSFISE